MGSDKRRGKGKYRGRSHGKEGAGQREEGTGGEMGVNKGDEGSNGGEERKRSEGRWGENRKSYPHGHF